jgi:hypothetical protein
LVEILIDSIQDVLPVIPVLFVAILLADWITLKVKQGTPLFSRLSKLDVIGGALLGIVPQCGISVAFSELYANGFITLGMLMAVYLACSDEALIIIIANPGKIPLVLGIILLKLLVAIGAGFLINLLIREKRNRFNGCNLGCDCPKCRTHENIIVNSLIQTVKLSLFLYLIVALIALGVNWLGEARFYALLGRDTFFQPILAALIGMIPSCFSSVLLAESFLKGALGFGSVIAGLLANTGFGILVLFRELPLKKTLWISLLLLTISILVGELLFFYHR